jgi:hypothetical protein
MMKKFAVVLAAMFAVFGLGAAAHAQYTGAPEISVDIPNPLPGGSFNTGIAGCEPGQPVSSTFDGATQTATAAADGSASFGWNAPTEPGVYVGSTTCNAQTVNWSVEVLAPPPTNGGSTAPTGGGSLPSTGSGGISGTTTVAIGLLVVGFGLFGVTQIRRRQTVAA